MHDIRNYTRFHLKKVNRKDHDQRSRLENDKQGLKNPVRLVARETDVCTAARNILGTIIEDFLPLAHKNVCQLTKLSRKRQMTVKFTTSKFWVLRLERALCHPSSTQNCDMAPTFLKLVYPYVRVRDNCL